MRDGAAPHGAVVHPDPPRPGTWWRCRAAAGVGMTGALAVHLVVW
jgi:hypothetical protein